ncbi:hypothetical protein [Tenacibaculum sp.]|uniref:hypothetical protein n=1 Tax=Tenacibaculum sp. TaxID=1906242 RepID=UPI003D09B56B
MVDVLEPYAKEIQAVKKDLPNILRKILIRRKDDVIRILKEDQLSKGLDSSGKVVGTYSRVTEQIALEKALLGRSPRKPKVAGKPYNFEDTGGFFDGFSLKFEDFESFTLFSRDSKAEFLKQEYGDIDTLTKTNNERINQEILRPEMYDEIIKRLFT